MMKRQRHYSGWEIAGLIGSTLGMLNLSLAPLIFFLTTVTTIMASDIIGSIPSFIALAMFAATLSLIFRQWFKPRLVLSIFVSLSYLLLGALLIYEVNDALLHGGNYSELLSMSLTGMITHIILNFVTCALTIWMNRPRWRKVIPSPIEAFE